MRKVRIVLKKPARDCWWVILACFFCFVLGCFIIFAAASDPLSDFENVEGTFYSYRATNEGKAGRIIYITIDHPQFGLKEYRIINKHRQAFDETEFLNNVEKGDYLRLIIVEDNLIFEMEDESQYYSTLTDSQKYWNNDNKGGCFLGAIFALVGIIGFFSCFRMKRRRR